MFLSFQLNFAVSFYPPVTIPVTVVIAVFGLGAVVK